jgi:uncharacterized protein YbjT (DUF2867 family)
MKTALILGSTGLTGSFLLQALIADERYTRLVVVNRKKAAQQHPKLFELISDFQSPLDLSGIERIDTVFSCLGTTRKQTPDLDAYRKIEIEIPVEVARSCLGNGLQNFHYISSVGASATARNFYLKMKGESELALSKTGIPHLHIYQPSFLIGPRKEKRIAEKIATSIVPFFDFLWVGKASKYKSMPIDKLVKSMIAHDNKKQSKPVELYTYDQIIQP